MTNNTAITLHYFACSKATVTSDSVISFLTWQQANDLLHLFLKANFQYSVCLINDQTLKVLENKGPGVLDTREREGGREGEIT